MTPEEISSLADRIDSEELWRVSPLDQDKLTSEQQDRLWAGRMDNSVALHNAK